MEYYSQIFTKKGMHYQAMKILRETLGERSQSSKAIYCMTATSWHSGKCKTMNVKSEKTSGCKGSGRVKKE